MGTAPNASMYLLDVIPIIRSAPGDALTYFSKDRFKHGTIVFVPIRTRHVPALVIGSRRVSDAKASLRASRFSIKKVSGKKPTAFLPQAFINAVLSTAEISAAKTGGVLGAAIPRFILDAMREGALPNPVQEHSKRARAQSQTSSAEKLIFQAQTSERVARYRSIIRESFAARESVFIAAPTIAHAEWLARELSRGIEEYAYCLHTGRPKKKLLGYWQSALSAKHPILIIATPIFISLFRKDIATLIIENEHSRAYKLPRAPRIDMRVLLEEYAHASGIRLILADMPLRIETLYRHRTGNLGELVKPYMRLLSPATTRIIDMREEERRIIGNKGFTILSSDLVRALAQTTKNGGRAFLFTARRGIAPITVCKDCGSPVMSSDNTIPMVLHKTSKGNAFISHQTGELRDAHERCRNCKSWHLVSIGIGIERAEEAVRQTFPDLPLFRIDRDTTSTHRQVLDAIQTFYETPSAILLGTELAVSYLKDPLELCGIVSADSMLSLPEWRITERVFSLLVRLRELSTAHLLIQTRKAGAQVLPHALSGNIDDFYQDEIKLRETFSYPPFSALIKMSVTGEKKAVEHEIALIAERFEAYDLHVYPASIRAGSNRETRHALLRLQRGAWPEAKLVESLRGLPPYVVVDVDPENLL